MWAKLHLRLVTEIYQGIKTFKCAVFFKGSCDVSYSFRAVYHSRGVNGAI